MNLEKEFIERKYQLAKFDLETGFSCNVRHTNQITAIRGWCITLIVAYLGLLFTKSDGAVSFLHLSPLILIIVGFSYLELNEKVHAQINAKNVRDIQNIFSHENEEIFKKQISEYITRDLYFKENFGREKSKYLKMAIKSRSTYSWPTLLLVSIFIIWFVLNNLYK